MWSTSELFEKRSQGGTGPQDDGGGDLLAVGLVGHAEPHTRSTGTSGPTTSSVIASRGGPKKHWQTTRPRRCRKCQVPLHVTRRERAPWCG